tara:strand:- start:456 stop:1229 length:774 start_codon:yes stop_codon:yes gene_type:complete
MVTPLNNRKVLELKGSDCKKFLQNLVSNDINLLDQGLVYSALLTPQGKYIADFFVVPLEDTMGVDVHAELAKTLLERLNIYKLRSDVEIKEADISVALGLTNPPKGALTDPRHPKLGWRLYSKDAKEFDQPVNWTKLRVDYVIPEYGSELNDESYILEMGFERLHGVDFKKGCYIGQEVTARMKHKTELRKGLVKISSEQDISNGEKLLLNDKPVGSVLTTYGKSALAYVRLKNRDAILSTKNSKNIVVDKDPILSN